MRALAGTALLACACATTAPAPEGAALDNPKGRIELAARLAGPSERESFPDPGELGPYVRARRLHAEDSAAESELDAAFPGCSLSAWELDTCGTLPGDPTRFTLALVEARTRLSLARSEVPIGGERLRLLVAIAFDHAPDGSLVLAFTVYRIEPASLEPLLHCTVEDAPASALSVMPCGMEHASGWRTLFLDHKGQVIQCWCTPERFLDSFAAHQYQFRSTDGFMMTGGSVEHEELLRIPLEQWPEPVWMLTLVPAGP
jgi:hypothetical protein